METFFVFIKKGKQILFVCLFITKLNKNNITGVGTTNRQNCGFVAASNEIYNLVQRAKPSQAKIRATLYEALKSFIGPIKRAVFQF